MVSQEHFWTIRTFKCKLGEHPEVLVLLLKRFVLDYHCMEYVKNDSLVDVPLNIDVPEGVSYDLYATVDHYGNLRGGHYTATIRPPESVLGRWYKFDNSRVKELHVDHGSSVEPPKLDGVQMSDNDGAGEDDEDDCDSGDEVRQRFGEGRGGRPTRPRPGEVPGSGEGGKKTGDTEVSINETKSHSEAADRTVLRREAGGSANKASGSAPEAGGSTHKASGSAPETGGSAHKARGSAPEAGGSAHKASGSAPEAGGSAHKASGSAPEAGGSAHKASGFAPEAGGSAPPGGRQPEEEEPPT
ncbi:hypothetical protein NHX12_014416 [Muraenolepis orangiensis]|uniref:ubiquitinyl hydrolase 1 n=1 Tax=Muraenolepis orangiensis TaxID=630683 RepID=A0A9Q0DCF4_9TELE|nr:hypothetical protein NHX12_014416 [Muraenolepis orangiensis]